MNLRKIILVLGTSVILLGCDSVSVPTAPVVTSNSGNPVSRVTEATKDLLAPTSSMPQRINGRELETVRGWFAGIYPWAYIPHESPMTPVPSLFTPYQTQSHSQMQYQIRQLQAYGSEVDVLEYNPDPGHPDHDHWERVYFRSSNRPFFLLYEHIFGTGFTGGLDMSNPRNREVFKQDIDRMFRKVILPYQNRYVTVNGKAIIYFWSSVQMRGDFASLLNEVRETYPVFFLGSEGGVPSSSDTEGLARVKALDGIMDYSLGGTSNYLQRVTNYRKDAIQWRKLFNQFRAETGKRYYLIPVFQAAYDDTKVPGRTTPTMYPRSIREVYYHAELLRRDMGTVFDALGPYVVYNEIPEGAAVLETECTPDRLDTPTRWIGCGFGRIDVVKKYFGF